MVPHSLTSLKLIHGIVDDPSTAWLSRLPHLENLHMNPRIVDFILNLSTQASSSFSARTSLETGHCNIDLAITLLCACIAPHMVSFFTSEQHYKDYISKIEPFFELLVSRSPSFLARTPHGCRCLSISEVFCLQPLPFHSLNLLGALIDRGELLKIQTLASLG